MAVAMALSSKNTLFWIKKRNAFKKFGEPNARPQNCYRDYVLHRRNLNNGSMDYKWEVNTRSDEIHNSVFPDHLLQFNVTTGLLPLYTKTEFKVVDNQDNFRIVLSFLKENELGKEIALDLEGNNDHSFLGMICLIQTAARNNDIIFDVFPLVEHIKTELAEYLKDPSVLKYMWGCGNDALWLKRCFFIDITNVLDVQILFQYILRNGLLAKICLINKDEYVLSNFLDSRQKLSLFKVPWNPEEATLNVRPLREVMAVIYFNYEDQSAITGYLSETISSPIKQNSVPTETRNSMFDLIHKSRADAPAPKTEIELYLEEEISPETENPLEYWKVKCSTLPILGQLARRYLGIPASSGGIERVFSIAGAISSARRASTTVKQMESIIFMRELVQPKLLKRLTLTKHRQTPRRKRRRDKPDIIQQITLDGPE